MKHNRYPLQPLASSNRSVQSAIANMQGKSTGLMSVAEETRDTNG